MYALNIKNIRNSAKIQGYKNLKSLIEKTGLHRNVLNRYIAGAPVLPDSVTKIIRTLGLNIEKAIIWQELTDSKLDIILPLANQIHFSYPNVSVFLFGSRSRGKARKYSDFDICVFSKNHISLDEYLKILSIKEDFEDQSSFFVDCVNLHNADKSFLKNIFPDLRLLAGYQTDLNTIKELTYE